MKYFGLFSVLLAVSIGVVWSVSGLTRGGEVDENGESQKASYQDAIDSARDAADSISNVGASKVEIYDGISYSENSTVVDVSGQNLTGSLKAEVRQLQNLKELDLSNNKFTGIPAEVGQLRDLQILNLSNNPFTGLPLEIGNLQNLQVLDVSGTQYSQQDLDTIVANLPAATRVITE